MEEAFLCAGATLWHFAWGMVGSETFTGWVGRFSTGEREEVFIWVEATSSSSGCSPKHFNWVMMGSGTFFFIWKGLIVALGFSTGCSTVLFFGSEVLVWDRMEGSGASWSLSPLDKTIGHSLLPDTALALEDVCALLGINFEDCSAFDSKEDLDLSDLEEDFSRSWVTLTDSFEVFDGDDWLDFDDDFFVGDRLPEDDSFFAMTLLFSLSFSLLFSGLSKSFAKSLWDLSCYIMDLTTGVNLESIDTYYYLLAYSCQLLNSVTLYVVRCQRSVRLVSLPQVNLEK